MMPATRIRMMIALGGTLLFAACGGTTQSAGSVEPRNIQLLPFDGGRANIAALLLESSFAQQQLRYARVRAARNAAQQRIRRTFAEQGIDYPAAEIFVRVLKRPRLLEVWARPIDGRQFRLLKTYDICALAGVSGPKRRQGDQQVPEGFYYIDSFNPTSEHHLSLRIDYPNARDRAANPGSRLGGDIFIHGGCKSEGCLAVTDHGIQELYWLAVEARSLGQERIPVHIFPTWLTDAEMRHIDFHYAREPALIAFWKTLKPGYDYFERKRRIPRTTTDARGRYLVAD